MFSFRQCSKYATHLNMACSTSCYHYSILLTSKWTLILLSAQPTLRLPRQPLSASHHLLKFLPVTRKATMAACVFPVHLKDLSEGSCCNRMLIGHTCSRLSGHRRISCTRNHTYRYVWFLVQLILLCPLSVLHVCLLSILLQHEPCMSTKPATSCIYVL